MECSPDLGLARFRYRDVSGASISAYKASGAVG